MVKKCKLSGLNDVELAVAYKSLLALKDTLQFDVVDEVASISETAMGSMSDEEGFVRPLTLLLIWMGKKLEQPQPYDFASVDADSVLMKNLHLQQWGLALTQKPQASRVEDISALQPKHIWSSENLHRHLTWLEQLVPQSTSARPWIDAFFFRASVLVREGERMVLNIEHTIPTSTVRPTAMTTLAGQINYSAIVAKTRVAETYMMAATMMQLCRLVKQESTAAGQWNLERQELTSSTVSARRLLTGFFVVESKPNCALIDNLSQAASDIYACATLLNQKFLRGALTNGHEWIFIIIRVNQDAPGGKFKISPLLTLYVAQNAGGEDVQVDKFSADRITAVLSYWIEHSFEDIGNDDWFEPITWGT